MKGAKLLPELHRSMHVTSGRIKSEDRNLSGTRIESMVCLGVLDHTLYGAIVLLPLVENFDDVCCSLFEQVNFITRGLDMLFRYTLTATSFLVFMSDCQGATFQRKSVGSEKHKHI